MTLAEKIRTSTDDQLADILLSMGVFGVFGCPRSLAKKALLNDLQSPYVNFLYFLGDENEKSEAVSGVEEGDGGRS